MGRKILISYDKEADVMYLSFDEPIKAESEEIESGVFARFDPETKELKGLTVVNFSKKFDMSQKPKQILIPAQR